MILRNKKSMALIWSVLLFLFATAHGQSSRQYDIVLMGGRVIDPETHLDTIKNVGIINNHIAQISSEPLKGKEIIDVSGLVVAPGFIDLHVHGRGSTEQEYKLHDGVTTMLELEWGIEFIGKWVESRRSKSLINYGGSVCWPFERFKALSKYESASKELYQEAVNGTSSFDSLFSKIKFSLSDTLTPDQMTKTLQNIRGSLAEGAIGIGVPIGYLPTVKQEEVFRVYQLAGELKAPVFTHVREGGIPAIQQAIADAVLTGAPLHIVHINSSSLGKIYFATELVQTAINRGFDITTELYPYTAASTLLQSAVFNEGWQERQGGITYSDLQWVATGERLTKETFQSYRKTGGMVIIHDMKPEWIRYGISLPNTIIASDAMPYAPMAHPRTAGTFSRVLGKYVREEKALSLSTAIEKMTLLPARRLEGIAPMMHYKGRIQVGADADITIFNPSTVIDKASFEKGLAFSEGIEYVIVNGVIVLKNGKTVADVFPGQPVYGKYKN
jgi:dihydroorotase